MARETTQQVTASSSKEAEDAPAPVAAAPEPVTVVVSEVATQPTDQPLSEQTRAEQAAGREALKKFQQ